MTKHWSDAQAEAAQARGRAMMAEEPRAVAARYDARSERIVVELISGATFAFPPRLVQGLEDATAEQLAELEVIGVGFALHWETLKAENRDSPYFSEGRMQRNQQFCCRIIRIFSVC